MTTVKSKKNGGKKRKISKHILESQTNAIDDTTSTVNEIDVGTSSSSNTGSNTTNQVLDQSIDSSTVLSSSSVATTSNTNTTSSSNKKRKRLLKLNCTKDITDVESYLLSWQASTTTPTETNNSSTSTSSSPTATNDTATTACTQTTTWKYNKNTQSWIIRHMYDSTKISKHMFTIVINYLLQGITKQQQEQINSKNTTTTTTKNKNKKVKVENTKTKSNNTIVSTLKQRIIDDATRREIRYKEYEKQLQLEGITTTVAVAGLEEIMTTSTSNDTNDDTILWTKLNDHDKRKEYKRARKVLDAIR